MPVFFLWQYSIGNVFSRMDKTCITVYSSWKKNRIFRLKLAGYETIYTRHTPFSILDRLLDHWTGSRSIG
jgi:hypothetical protein